MSRKKDIQLVDSRGYPLAAVGGTNYGGYHNERSGSGGWRDKSRGGFFLPTLINNRSAFEVIYAESWAAKKFIDLCVDDMLAKPRLLESLNAKDYDQYNDYHKVVPKLSRAIKLAKLLGTAFFVPITTETADLSTPLDLNKLQKGDLANILILDRFRLTGYDLERNPYNPNYGMLKMYHFYSRAGASLVIHPSRVFRFDGIESLTTEGWDLYNYYWGISELIPVLQCIYQDAQAANGASHLLEEANIDVVKVENFKDILKNPITLQDGDIEIDRLADEINRGKSIYNMLMMDTADEYDRKQVSFSGLAQVIDVYAARLAAAGDYPKSRFLGEYPGGLNNGTGDDNSYADKIKKEQSKRLAPFWTWMDPILQRTSGINLESLDYEYPSFLPESDETKVATFNQAVQAVTAGVDGDVLSDTEARTILAKTKLGEDIEPNREGAFASEDFASDSPPETS